MRTAPVGRASRTTAAARSRCTNGRRHKLPALINCYFRAAFGSLTHGGSGTASESGSRPHDSGTFTESMPFGPNISQLTIDCTLVLSNANVLLVRFAAGLIGSALTPADADTT